MAESTAACRHTDAIVPAPPPLPPRRHAPPKDPATAAGEVVLGASDDSDVDPAEIGVEYRTDDLQTQHTTLDRVRARDLLQSAPIRAFRAYKGRKNYSGLFWSATTGTHLAYESLLELRCLLELDYAADVGQIACQPLSMTRLVDGRPRRRIPDMIVADPQGRVTVIDVKPLDRLDDPAVQAAFVWTHAACMARGWGYRVWTGPQTPVRARNLQLLACYRRAERIDPAALEAVRAHVHPGEPIRSLEYRTVHTADVHRALVRSAVLHLIWHQHLRVDLDQQLTADTIVEV